VLHNFSQSILQEAAKTSKVSKSLALICKQGNKDLMTIQLMAGQAFHNEYFELIFRQ